MGLRKLDLALLSLGYSLAFFDIFNVPYIENYSSKEIGLVPSALILSAEMIGYVLGGLINGYLSARSGRRAGLIASSLTIALGSSLGLTANSFAQLFLAELIIGVGIEGEISVVPAYISEMVGPDVRGKSVGLVSASGFLMSLVVGPLAVLLNQSYWRLLFLPSLLLALVSLAYRLTLKESGMWLERRGQRLVWDKGALIFLVIWFASYFTGYALFSTPVFELIRQKGLNDSLAFTYILYGDPLGVIAASVLADKLERKYGSTLPNLLTAVLMVLWPFSPNGLAFLALGFAIMLLQGFKFPMMYAYTAENFPTKFRTVGFGIADGLGHLGGALGPLVYALLSQNSLSASTALVGSVSAISGALILTFGLKTTGVPLEKLKG
ncbi:MAG: MFS transporter [Sulfolobales archaeon]|nr:MFS transporter [Sulfolobales archaeon]